MKKILVVDDNEAIRAHLRESLEAEGRQISVAQSGAEAIEMTFAVLPDLIILDMVMPDLTGYEVVRLLAIHPETSGIRVIFTSRNLGPHQRMLARTGRDHLFLKKPIDSNELGEKVRMLLEGDVRGSESKDIEDSRNSWAFSDIEDLFTEEYIKKRAMSEMLRAKKHGYPFCGLKMQFAFPEWGMAVSKHQAHLIKEIATLLKKSKRTIDIAGFCGDFTFLLIIPRAAKSQALVFAQKLKNIFLSHSFNPEADCEAVEVSMGLHHFDEQKDTEDDMFLKMLDESLALARESGGNQLFAK
jgi:diguanylate cyclase (GGDEF)-like protein